MLTCATCEVIFDKKFHKRLQGDQPHRHVEVAYMLQLINDYFIKCQNCFGELNLNQFFTVLLKHDNVIFFHSFYFSFYRYYGE